MEESGLNQEHHPDAANLKDIVPNGIKTNPFITPSIIHQPPEDVRFGEQDFRQLEYHVPPVQNEPNYNGPYREQGKDPLTPQQVSHQNHCATCLCVAFRAISLGPLMTFYHLPAITITVKRFAIHLLQVS
jgi:hypothetical protein